MHFATLLINFEPISFIFGLLIPKNVIWRCHLDLKLFSDIIEKNG